MHVIFFTKYTRMGASSRLRTFQFIPYIEKAGIQCTIAPFFKDDYLEELYRTRHHNKKQALKSFLNRCVALLSVNKYDLVVIEKELFPYFPAIAENLLKLFKIPYIVDYDDAVWHNYDVSPNRAVRSLLGNKIDVVMARSSAVIAGNDYIRQKAKKNNVRDIPIFPTVIDTKRYSLKEYKDDGAFTIGWVGSPITFKYLPYLKPVFQKLASTHRIRLKLVGTKAGLGLGELETILPWSEESEVADIQSFNVGIMPLEDNIWERGKCGYKLIQYMGCGVPVIGTPIGANDSIIANGVNGFKATSLDEWYDSFLLLIKGGVSKERELGMSARQSVEMNYSLQSFGSRYAELIWSHQRGR